MHSKKLDPLKTCSAVLFSHTALYDLSSCTRLFEWLDFVLQMEPTTSSFSVLKETKFSVLEPATRSKPGTSLESIPEEDLKKLSLPSEFSLPSDVLATQSKQEPNTILSEIRHVDTVVGVGDDIS